MAKNSKSGRRKLTDGPTWHDYSNAWRKRATIGGKQVTKRYKFPNSREGLRMATDAWLADLGKLKESEAMGIEVMTQADQRYWHPPTVSKPYGHLSDLPPLPKTHAADVMTWNKLADKFEEAERLRLDRKEIEPITFAKGSKRTANRMRKQWGGLVVPQTEDELGVFLGNWRHGRELAVSEGEIKPATLSTEASQLGKFLRWAHRQYLISCPLPRNLSDIVKQGSGSSTAKSIPNKTLGKMFKVAPERTRLFMLLALNCGFKGSDIGKLKVGDYDPKRQTIDVNRTKTAKKANHGKGVRVRYKLWDMTAKLLKRYANKGDAGDLLLTSESGGPLWYVSGDSSLNYPSQEFSRLMKRNDIKGFVFENLRDTGSTWFYSNLRSERATYLAHADSSVGVMYTDSSAVELDKALAEFHQALLKFGQTVEEAIREIKSCIH